MDRENIPPPPVAESPHELWQRSMSNFVATTCASIKVDTRAGYCTAVGHYKRFCSAININVSDPDSLFLRTPVPGRFSPLPWAVTVLGLFLVHCVNDLPVQGDVACGYLAGVRKFFSENCAEGSPSPFLHHKLTEARTALRDRTATESSRLARRFLPFTHAMLNALLKCVCPVTLVRDHCIVVAVYFGMTLLCRCSEILFSAKDHFLRGSDVVFHVRLPDGTDTVICSSDAHLHASCQLCCCYLLMRSAKNDAGGEGVPYLFYPAKLSTVCAFCIATELFRWAVRGRPLPENPFFSYRHPTDGFILSYQSLNDAIVSAARYVVAPELLRRIGTRSLRISGATLLHASGKGELSIQEYMRSKSNSFLRYIRQSSQSIESSRAATANPTTYTAVDLRVQAFSSLVPQRSLPL